MQSPVLLLRGGRVTWLEYIFADVIMQRLKVRNLGVRACGTAGGGYSACEGCGRTMNAVCSFQQPHHIQQQ